MMGLVRLILVAFLVYAGFRTVLWAARTWTSLTSGNKNRRKESDRQVSDMVQDPVCKMYILSHEAVTIQENGRSVYFCSAECRDRYLDGRR